MSRHHRRARPTVRVLREDLGEGLKSKQLQRRLGEGDLEALHPLSELPHPIVEKALSSFGPDPGADHHEGLIASSGTYRFLEIKSGQWRGAVHRDGDGVHWLVAAGLAKGDHLDHDDFYEALKRRNSRGTLEALLPTTEDDRLLRRETAQQVMVEWELGVQRAVAETLETVAEGGSQRFEIRHPVLDEELATVEIAVACDDEDGATASEDLLVTIMTRTRHQGSNLEWDLTLRLLTVVWPPEQDWYRLGNEYSLPLEPGSVRTRLTQIQANIRSSTLEDPRPGGEAHYSHVLGLAGSTIDGTAVRALCGVYFVPRQDHESLDRCERCSVRHARLSP